MAQFLRDKHISDIVIDVNAISQLVDVFASQGISMPEYDSQKTGEDATVFLSFTIRFDEKGYRVFDKNQLLQYFNQAAEVERIVFELISADAVQSNRQSGSYVDLRLDTNESIPCYLTVASDDENWMKGAFAAIGETLGQQRNQTNKWLRNPFVEILTQLAGVLLGFVVSLLGASRIAPHLAINNAYLISFLLILLLFSNLWGPVNEQVKRFMVRTFPRVRFERPGKDRWTWLYRTMVGGLVVAATLYILGFLFSFAGSILSGFVSLGS